VDWSLIFDSTIKAAVNKEAMVFALAAVGLNLHFGYTGLLNFGQAGFIAIGAYGAAISVEFYNWSLWAGLASGLVFGIIFALPHHGVGVISRTCRSSAGSPATRGRARP